MKMDSKQKEKLLLHVCCAPCAPYVIEKISEDFELVIFFYNPNISPRKEYELRQMEAEGYVRSLGLQFCEWRYDAQRWNSMIQGLEEEPEGGARCEVCFRIRLNKTALLAQELGIKNFATTLTVSPHKNAALINKIGRRYAENYGLNFLDYDFKKNDGFRISCQKSNELGFYRQDYCGCIFSKKERAAKKEEEKEFIWQQVSNGAPLRSDHDPDHDRFVF